MGGIAPRFRAASVAALLAAVLLACGSPSTATDSPSTASGGATTGGDGGQATAAATTGEEPAADDAAARLDAIYGELEGLEGEERRSRLLELAEDEDGELVVYGTASQELLERLVNEFTELTGVQATLYRAPIHTMLQRLGEERTAGGVRADVLLANDPEITTLSNDGFFLPLKTPATDTIDPDYVHDDRAGFAILYYAVGWNTDTVPEDRVPTTWEEALAFDGALILEQNSYDLFATLVTQYFVGEKGMTEDEAVQLFREAAAGTPFGAGKTTILQSLLSGESDLSPTLFMHSLVSESRAGAPVAWRPPVQPLPGRSNAVAILADGIRPAKALLFADYMLTDAQESIADENYPPATTEPVSNFEVNLADYDTIPMDIELLVEEREHWEDLWLELISGGQSIEAPAGGG